MSISHKIFPMENQGDKKADQNAERFAWLLEESKKLSGLIDVPDDTMIEIYQSSSDWEFILKIDALLEAAVRKVVKVALTATPKMDSDALEGFVDTLSMRGRNSLLTLLKAAGCAVEEVDLIDCVRRMRNGFAHDITQVKSTLIEVIKRRSDKSFLINGLSYTEKYDETKLIKMFEEDGKFLRFTILTGTLTFLVLAYHAVVKDNT